MTEHTSLDDAGFDSSFDQEASGGPTVNPVLFVHRRLRGRYRYAIPLALILALPLALVGYFAVKPTFESTGLIQVRPSQPRVIYQTEENEVPPLFSSLVRAQVSFLQSRRVLDMAVGDPRLIEAGWARGPAGVGALKNSLIVRNDRNGQIISVSVTDTDPKAARAAVNAVLDAYQEIYGEQGELSVSQKERQLVDREATLDRELQSLRERIFQIADEYGADTLDRLHEARVSEMERLDAELSDLNFLIASAQQRVDAQGEDAGAIAPRLDASERFATLDSQLASLLREELRLQARIDSLSDRYGPNHREMKRLADDLSEVRSAIDLRTASLLEGGSVDASQLSGDPAAALEQLQSRKAQYDALLDRTRREAISLGRKKLQIDSLTEQANEKKTLLEETRRRLESIRVESAHSETGRIIIAQRGDTPVTPAKDRRLPLAVAGAGMGVGISFALFFLLGLSQDGYRYIDELRDVDGVAPLLGTLPDLTGGDIESDELAALSVHHLRNVLQLRDGNKENLVYTITSATSGDGKTSLTLALGMSFAVSGRKTLLLDSDLVGRGLTHELGLDGEGGLCQAIDSGTLNGDVHQTRIDNLWALPAGHADEFEPERLSHKNVERLLSQLREQYDIVLIDTGPLLGSLEANLVSVLSDGVVLTISRGRSPKLVDASLERLKRLGARCAGLVFNKATAHDLERSVSHFSFHSQSLRSQPRQDREIGRGRSGLLVRAVGSGGSGGLPGSEEPASKAS